MSDLKKGRPSTAPLESSDNSSIYYDAIDDIDESQLNLQAPTFQRVRRSSGLDGEHEHDEIDEKVCRICLEEDSPETMIAPCRCKGGSKWVHRECLDEWRTNEKDRAFSKCTECLFEYYLQPVYRDDDTENDAEGESGCCSCSKPQRRHTLFYWMVSRDVCLGIVLQQLIVVFLGAVVCACDPNHELPGLLLGMGSSSSSSSSSSQHHFSQRTMGWMYYGFGWFTFFIGLGLYGSVVMCTNGCDIKRAIPKVGPPSEADEEAEPTAAPVEGHVNSTTTNSNQDYNYSLYRSDDSNYEYPSQQHPREQHHQDRHQPRSSCSSSTDFYRRARRRRYRHRRYYYNDYYYGPTFYPMYVYPGHDMCCCYCCCDSGAPQTSAGSCCGGGGGGTGGCCGAGGCPRGIHSSTGGSGGSSSNSGGNNGHHILLIIMLVVAVILAIIGLFVGVVVIAVAAQRIVGRHIYLLQKRQLVQEFRVMDLQDYELDQPISTASVEDDGEGGGKEGLGGVGGDPGTAPSAGGGTKHPPPYAPVMPVEDSEYLKNLGLMDH